MENNKIIKLSTGILVAILGIFLAHQYEVNTTTLFIMTLGFSIFSVGLRSRLLGVFTGLIGVNLVFISITYEDIGIIIKIICASIGTAGLIRGFQIQLRTFVEILQSDS